jgi:hypothetical protein
MTEMPPKRKVVGKTGVDSHPIQGETLYWLW